MSTGQERLPHIAALLQAGGKFDDLAQAGSGAKAGLGSELIYQRFAAAHIIKPWSVGFAIRQEFNR